ncbi:hypothetical protein [Formosa maritima]|uniref:DUF5004 domain-containing protein n=1 Tax=Formosa maritima TaxID=2592046 RepID=A0A5D0G9Z8_9FLAO|nr:hypothetical protein [Formosa maritima]TYA55684.1 hypothetical protein FVF61_07135 [Formosa maritima]
MKTKPKFIHAICIVLITLFSCSEDSPLLDPYQNNNSNNNNNNNEVTYTIADIQGTWLRTGGNHTGNIGMVIEVTDNDGVIVDPIDSGFEVDDVKWMNILPSDISDFTHSELGSDYNYYSATLDFESENVILISVDAGGAGNYQEWTRQ